MVKYQKILVALDASISSHNAMLQAAALAKKTGATITLVSIVVPPDVEMSMLGSGAKLTEILTESADELLLGAQEELRTRGLEAQIRLERGVAFEKIALIAVEETSDLIVLGRRGQSRLERVLMGNVASRVIGHSSVDVMVVPREAVLGWDNILLATDGSVHSEAALEGAISYAANFSGKLTALNVVAINDEFYTLAPDAVDGMIEQSKEMLKNIIRLADDQSIESETFTVDGNAYKKIVEMADCIEAGVIFMGCHGRSGLGRLLMGSVCEKVIGHAMCPVIVSRRTSGQRQSNFARDMLTASITSTTN